MHACMLGVSVFCESAVNSHHCGKLVFQMLLCRFQCMPCCSACAMLVLSDGVGNGDSTPALTI